MKHLYSRFLAARPDILHMSPHSHYYWPDVTRDAHMQFWDDSALHADDKWDIIFGERMPSVQRLIAQRLNIDHPEQIVFAPNTHELVYRLISCFDPAKQLRILTTDAEFHSFNRQSRRILERGNVHIEVVSTMPFATFPDRWRKAVQSTQYELIFISQIFFNSGVAAPQPSQWLDAVQNPETLIVVDGYHGFGAVPTDWSAYQDKIFYLAGGYKYAQGGEGACFAVVPTECQLRPEYTGWFADFASLAQPQEGPVGYSSNGMRFAGATMDYSALYRLESVLKLWQTEGLTDQRIHSYIKARQQAFLARIEKLQHSHLNQNHLLVDDFNNHGHFFTYKLESPELAQSLAETLRAQGVYTDYRYDRLRFGFALYHEDQDYERIRG